MATPAEIPKTIITITIEKWDGNYSHKRVCLAQISATEEFREKYDAEKYEDVEWLEEVIERMLK